ncbi:unnamed protein product [Oikopleura dioica]|uniref:Uncharacterized protein n=1 Tax=Oikopleura dioica TaxID=34765 RepID=E4XEM2_OIKDI|nr:unnamed protein product [Oikopleura dioica]CBY31131.1 unnamed protein product [Oikopleura dioica]
MRDYTFPLQHERELGNQIDQIMSADKYAFEQNYGSLYEYERELPSKNASVKSVTLAPTKENRYSDSTTDEQRVSDV